MMRVLFCIVFMSLFSGSAVAWCTQNTPTGYNLDPACFEPRPDWRYDYWPRYDYAPLGFEGVVEEPVVGPDPYGGPMVYGWEGWGIPIKPSSCGMYRYWNGEACLDARYFPPLDLGLKP